MVHTLRARWTGVKREPDQGEWFLSGDPIEAYRASYSPIPYQYHIAELVIVDTKRIEQIVKIWKEPQY